MQLVKYAHFSLELQKSGEASIWWFVDVWYFPSSHSWWFLEVVSGFCCSVEGLKEGGIGITLQCNLKSGDS